METPPPNETPLKYVEIFTFIVSFLVLGFIYTKFQTIHALIGGVIGVVLGYINFKFIQTAVRKINLESSLAGFGVGLIIKVLALMGLILILLLVVKINPLTFLMGFSCFILAIPLSGLVSVYRR